MRMSTWSMCSPLAAQRRWEPTSTWRAMPTADGMDQQAIDQAAIRIRLSVVEKFIDLCRSRRQAKEVEAQPSDQRNALGLRRGANALLLQPGEDEAVQIVGTHSLLFTSGRAGRLIG